MKKNLSLKNVCLIKKKTNEARVPIHYSDKFKTWEEDGTNATFLHIRTAPYVCVFTQRICEPNKFYADCIDRGDFFEQMHEEYIEEMVRTTCTEIGWFTSNLTNLCLEQGLDTATLLCFPYYTKTWNRDWEDIPWVKYPVLLLCSLGYSKQSRREYLHPTSGVEDKKPEKETVVIWR